MGWNLNELSSSAGAPVAAGNPAGYMFPAQGTQHVVYRGTDQHVHELWWDRNGWHHQDLTASAKAPPASFDPATYMANRQGTQHVIHAGPDGHVHELWWDESDWHHRDLSEATPRSPAIAGTPSAWMFDKQGTHHVAYRDREGRLQELWCDASGWHHEDLTTAAGNAPLCAGNPVGVAAEAAGTQHVLYRGQDHHIHELSWDASGWHHGDLTVIAGDAAPAAGDLATYLFAAQGTLHVAYRATDGYIHQLWRDGSGWHHQNLCALVGAPTAVDDPAGYLFGLQGTQHVLYRATDGLLHELWSDVNGWHHDVPGALGPLATGRPTGYSFEAQKTQHAFYRQEGGRVAELWWQPDGSGTGGSRPGAQGERSIALQWDPVVFDGGVPASGAATLSLAADGAWKFTGRFHNAGYSPTSVSLVWGVRGSKGTLLTFASSGALGGTLGSGSRDFSFELTGKSDDIKAAWDELGGGWNWQAQAGTTADFAKLWGDIKGAIGPVRAIAAIAGPRFE